MKHPIGLAPSIKDMETAARAAFLRLPEAFAQHLGNVVIQVQDFAEDELLTDMGIDHAFELTGVYEGLPLTERSIEHSGTMPDRIRLFRMPILLEWCERVDETFVHLVTHVLIHEIGHHFGLSDDDMHALEDQVR